MRIERLEYDDAAVGWRLAPTDFHPDVTLFVGHSAADKWQLLAALDTLARFGTGELPDEMWGVSWMLHFTVQGRTYRWTGEMSGRRYSLRDGLRADALLKLLPHGLQRGLHPAVVAETLAVDGRVVLSRADGVVRLHGRPLVAASPYQSAIHLAGNDAEVAAAGNGCRRVLFGEQGAFTLDTLGKPLKEMCVLYPTLEAVRAAKLPTYYKLAIVHETHPAFFATVAAGIRARFPQIEDIGFDRVTRGRFTDVPALRVLEKGTDQWLSERGGTTGPKISSERLQAVLNLAAVHLWPDGAVVLIDAFETSLGNYCLEPLLATTSDPTRNVQVICTSADPDVLDRVGRDRRKIVSWQGKVITVDAGAGPEMNPAQTTQIATAPGIAERWRRAHRQDAADHVINPAVDPPLPS